jgi:hypothetical protein
MDLGSWLIVLGRSHVDGEDLSCRIGRGLSRSGPKNCTAVGFGAAEARRKIHHDDDLRLKTIAEPGATTKRILRAQRRPRSAD